MSTQPLQNPGHYTGLGPQRFYGASNYEGESGVLLDETDFHDPYSRAAVEAHWPLDFRGGGPDPAVDTRTVTVRRVVR
jgi:hypothetical protein